jgi:poly(A) polymerase
VRPPKVYSIDEHKIPAYKIDKQAYYIIEKLRSSGFIAFLVGGSVRDLLLGVRPKDFDISTSAKPEDIKNLFKKNCILIGRRFRLAHVRFGKKILEVSTFRAGETEEATLILRDNVWGSPEKDVLRRDFTINGLFYDPEVQTIIDYVDGYTDIEKKILRTIGDPVTRFIQDPVRMIRLVKFKARFDFLIEEETFNAMLKCKNEIIKSSPNRIFEELLRMLESGSAKRFFQLLTKYEILNILSPGLAAFLQKNNKVYELLDIVDLYNRKNHLQTLDRAILISVLIFFILESNLTKNFIEKNIPIHLGIILQETRNTLDKIFFPFFQIPKKLKTDVSSILANQFRIMPLIKPSYQHIKIPKDPLFKLALDFFNLRSSQNPDLLKIYTLWNEKFVESHNKKRNFFKKSYG